MTMHTSEHMWSKGAIGLLDLDAFFASVEMLDHPEWRNKPLIVGGSSSSRGVVSTASYEARAYGVHSAMPSYQAERLCPNAIWTQGNYKRYREVSRQVMACIVDETPLVQQVSIDEAFFDITPGRYSNEDPVVICKRLQRRIDELGVSCSIGLSTSKTVAKIASEQQKPHGLSIVYPGQEQTFLSPLPVSAMSGIGKQTAQKLIERGIKTLGELAQQDPRYMQRLFGVWGPTMVQRAQGLEKSSISAYNVHAPCKSLSSERSFAQDLTSIQELEAAIQSAAEEVGTRLRAQGLSGHQVTLKLRFANRKLKTIQQQLPANTDDEWIFGQVALELLSQIWIPGNSVRLVGVGISGFSEARPQQLSLFEENSTSKNEEARGNRRNLSIAKDQVRARFGKQAIAFGRDLRLNKKSVIDTTDDPNDH